ncbi:Protein OBERON 2 [Nymphaea thermarum]|nr:Protein OBERON 2 [Nymphaea thermarum]
MLAKSEKAEKEYASGYLQQRLNEAEAEKRCLFEKIRLQESSRLSGGASMHACLLLNESIGRESRELGGKESSQLVDGGVVGGANVSALCLGTLEEENGWREEGGTWTVAPLQKEEERKPEEWLWMQTQNERHGGEEAGREVGGKEGAEDAGGKEGDDLQWWVSLREV